jgi:pimeloyl-ACP methyl ester carboxylesterase
MSKAIVCLVALTAFLTGNVYAQDLTGDWQGTLKAGIDLRLIIRISKKADGGWQVMLSSIDQNPDWAAGIPADTVALDGADFKLKIDALRGTYEGKLSADKNSIKGTWSQGIPLPLELQRATKETAWRDPSPHAARFVNVDKDVQLEVLDWGGSGQAIVFLAGLGNTAHVFDKFAPKLTDQYHVYGITRRGFGLSSSPSSGYSADRLGDDVLAVIDVLKLVKPVLAGHSIAGEELSSIGSRHPEKVAGLVYLDAAYAYAFYNASLRPAGPVPPAAPGTPAAVTAIREGMQKYTRVQSPALAIYAVPKDLGPQFPGDATARAAAEAADTALTEGQAKAFLAAVPSGRIVRLARANHYVFGSNEADVLKEMRDFITGLGK